MLFENYTFPGARAGYLGDLISNNILPSTLFLDPGSYSLMGSAAPVSAPSPRPSTSRSRSPGPIATKSTSSIARSPCKSPGAAATAASQNRDLRRSGGHALQLERELRLHRTGRSHELHGSARYALESACHARESLHSKDIVYVIAMSGSSIQDLKATDSIRARPHPSRSTQDGSAAMIRFSMSTKLMAGGIALSLALDRFGRLRVRFRQAR